ncbi:acyltransferase family protein [Corynebacterium choanae]|uniref:Acyltransferase family protein n=1 Tax=Corynebacterium choanae TaxID=1862358 RepID=A0A3G6JB93_9CORY|nr:acyltransferase [Corynebacterium choanae]AZA13890.1 Acyltransferase family protein [Corynebacterium choanae]
MSHPPAVLRRPTLPSLTGARWWAAAAVFLLHALVFLAVYPFQTSDLFARIHQFVPMQLGSAGVTFFFILSGFLIYWSNSELSSLSEAGYYWRRRLTKIMPMHLITAVLFVLAAGTVAGVVAAQTAGNPVHWWSFALPFTFDNVRVWLPNVLLIHTWNPQWALLAGLNVPAWSLASEMLFYLTFPLFLPLVRRLRGNGSWCGLAGAFALSAAIITAIHLFATGSKQTENFFVPRLWPLETSPVADVHAHPLWFLQESVAVDHTYWLSYYFPPTRLVEFYLGVFAAKLVWEGKFTNTRLGWPLALLVASFAVTFVVPVAFKMSLVMSLPMTAVVATLAVRDMHGLSGRISGDRMVLLGNISFAFYMVQFPVMVAVQRFAISGRTGGFATWLLMAVLAFVISVILAWVLFTFVDDPLMRATAKGGHNRNPHAPPSEHPLRRDIRILCGKGRRSAFEPSHLD